MQKKNGALMETFVILMGLTMDHTYDCFSKLIASLVHGFWAILALIGSLVMVIVVPVSWITGLLRRSTAK